MHSNNLKKKKIKKKQKTKEIMIQPNTSHAEENME